MRCPAFPLAVACLPVVAVLAAPTRARAADLAPAGHYRNDTVVLPGTRDKLADPEPKAAIKHGVLFINFDGVTTTMGGDFSQSDMSSIFGQEFAPFGGTDAERTAVVDAVKVDFELYDVEVITERPASGDYTMAVTSPTNPLGGGVLGIAPLDCYDGMPNNIVFAFHGAGDGFSPSGAAGTISHEAGHSYGLEHVDDGTDIMNPSNSGGDPTFRDNCTALVDPMIVCAPAHELHCPEGGVQNSHAELLEIFGSSTPDTMAPVVTITAPGDSDFFEVGSSFRIDVTATDDDEVRTVALFDGETMLMSSVAPPYGWDVFDVPEGVFEFTVRATDRVGNEGVSDVVTIYVGIEPPEAGTSSGTDGGGGQDGDGGGCGCTQASSNAAAQQLGRAALGLLVLPLLRRRRRAAAPADVSRPRAPRASSRRSASRSRRG